MTVVAKTLVASQYAQNSEAQVYRPNGTRAIIDRFTAVNNSASPAELSVWIVPNGGTTGGGNRMIYQRELASKESYSCPEIIGHVLESGDSLVVLASAGGAIAIRVSGREVTG